MYHYESAKKSTILICPVVTCGRLIAHAAAPDADAARCPDCATSMAPAGHEQARAATEPALPKHLAQP